MADLSIALDKTLVNEGFYNNLKQDAGGETYCGIARNSNPDWVGWKVVDKYKSEFGLPAFGQQIIAADKLVADFYKASYWVYISGDELKDQNFANLMFDIAVNCGVRGSILMTQEVIRDCFGKIDVTLDGKVGHKTIEAINACADGTMSLFGMEIPKAYMFLVQLTALRMKRYARLAKGGSAWAIPGWTARSFSYLGSK